MISYWSYLEELIVQLVVESEFMLDILGWFGGNIVDVINSITRQYCNMLRISCIGDIVENISRISKFSQIFIFYSWQIIIDIIFVDANKFEADILSCCVRSVSFIFVTTSPFWYEQIGSNSV